MPMDIMVASTRIIHSDYNKPITLKAKVTLAESHVPLSGVAVTYYVRSEEWPKWDAAEVQVTDDNGDVTFVRTKDPREYQIAFVAGSDSSPLIYLYVGDPTIPGGPPMGAFSGPSQGATGIPYVDPGFVPPPPPEEGGTRRKGR